MFTSKTTKTEGH